MPAVLIVGGPFHGELRHVSRFAMVQISDYGESATYIPYRLHSKRGTPMLLRCLVDVDLTSDAPSRLKMVIDAMMRNVPCCEPLTDESEVA